MAKAELDYDEVAKSLGMETHPIVHHHDEDGEEHNNKKAAAAVALAAAIAAGGTAAAELGIDYNNVSQPTPVVQDVNEMYAVDSDDKVAPGDTQTQTSVVEKFKSAVIAPIYAVGAGIMHFGDQLANLMAIPIVGALIKLALLAAVVLGSLALTFKLAFPDIPLSKVFTKRNVSIVLIAVTAISIGCEVIPALWPDAGIYVETFKVIGGFAIVVPIFVAVKRAADKVKSKLPGRSKESKDSMALTDGGTGAQLSLAEQQANADYKMIDEQYQKLNEDK